MKKSIGVFLFSLFLVILPSCSMNKSAKPLSWQVFPFERKITLKTESGEIPAVFSAQSKGTGRLTILAPEELAQITFLKNNDDCSVLMDDLILPLSEDFFPERGRLFRAFSFDENAEFLTDRKSEDGKKYTVFTFVNEDGNLIFYLDAENVLQKIVFEGENPFTCLFENEG